MPLKRKIKKEGRMTNNDVLRRIRYTLNYKDQKMISVFNQGSLDLSLEQLSGQLKKDTDPGYLNCSDASLASFLNGLIIEKRGAKGGAQPSIEKKITNNMVFVKLKIAFNLTSEGILEILDSAGLQISSHELSSFFRKNTHKNYRECKDQVLRNFLKGLQIKHRTNTDPEEEKITPERSEPKFVWKPLPSHKNT
ncbi:MAG: hypothetical protein ACJA2R_000487 [Saprospiraceae bacterium]|jgi:uncharacterized protein YehS (DUF1456 family)|tara:strand:- start:274 stop:855 length:582 start_codon:yes stop_codon:yes gene_type:complete